MLNVLNQPKIGTNEMSNIKDTSGPAFPFAWPADLQQAQPGMSLRDWFAGQALTAILNRTGYYTDTAEAAYIYADKMITERHKS